MLLLLADFDIFAGVETPPLTPPLGPPKMYIFLNLKLFRVTLP